MRLLGFEISKVPKPLTPVWHRASATPLGVRVTDMTPDQLRTELLWVKRELGQGKKVFTGPNDKFGRILSSY